MRKCVQLLVLHFGGKDVCLFVLHVIALMRVFNEMGQYPRVSMYSNQEKYKSYENGRLSI
jgi:hypothetical protein